MTSCLKHKTRDARPIARRRFGPQPKSFSLQIHAGFFSSFFPITLLLCRRHQLQHFYHAMVPYNGARTKVQLKLTIQRCKMLQEKKVGLLQCLIGTYFALNM